MERRVDHLLFFQVLGEVVRELCEVVLWRELEDEEVRALIEVVRERGL